MSSSARIAVSSRRFIHTVLIAGLFTGYWNESRRSDKRFRRNACGSRRRRESVAPSRGSFIPFSSGSWGSRPRLTNCRRSAARTERRRDFSTSLRLFAAERRRRDRFLAWGVNPPAAANRGRSRGSPAVGHSLATVRHDGRTWARRCRVAEAGDRQPSATHRRGLVTSRAAAP